jgi:hypothetical protein
VQPLEKIKNSEKKKKKEEGIRIDFVTISYYLPPKQKATKEDEDFMAVDEEAAALKIPTKSRVRVKNGERFD